VVETRTSPGLAWLLPDHLDVRDPARPIDEVERALADHLIGDVDVAASRIASLRLHRHSVAP
jgi:hypothetical protein